VPQAAYNLQNHDIPPLLAVYSLLTDG
jgi:hypothetical protein